MPESLSDYLCGSLTCSYNILDESYLFLITKRIEYILTLANHAIEYDRNRQYGCALTLYERVNTLLRDLLDNWPENAELATSKDRLETLNSAYFSRFTELTSYKIRRNMKDVEQVKPDGKSNEITFTIKDIPPYTPPPGYPGDPNLVPFWKFFLLYKVIVKGGHFGPAIYIPVDIWKQDNLHLPGIPMKIELITILVNDFYELLKDLTGNDQKTSLALTRNMRLNKKMDMVLKTIYTIQNYYSMRFTFVAPVNADKKKHVFRNHNVDLLIDDNTLVSIQVLNDYRQLVSELFNEYLRFKDIYDSIIVSNNENGKTTQSNDTLLQFIYEINSVFYNVFYYSTLLDLKYIVLHYISSVEKTIRR